MTADVQRDIGGLEARMDEHDKRFDRLEKQIGDGLKSLDSKIDGGFSQVYDRLNAISATENQRKGAVGLVKIILGSAGVMGLWEMIKGLIHK